MTVTVPLSYCGIKPLPKKYGLNSQPASAVGQSVITDEPPTLEEVPFFGNRHGNFQPTREVSDPEELATGGQVSNPKVAVTSINNKDGVGAGKDVYTLYLGDGSSFPKKSQWVSFEDM
jgi:hypothetical protein